MVLWFYKFCGINNIFHKQKKKNLKNPQKSIPIYPSFFFNYVSWRQLTNFDYVFDAWTLISIYYILNQKGLDGNILAFWIVFTGNIVFPLKEVQRSWTPELQVRSTKTLWLRTEGKVGEVFTK